MCLRGSRGGRPSTHRSADALSSSGARERGSIFLDVLIALMVGTLAIAVVLGGLSLAMRVVRRTYDRALEGVEARNQEMESRTLIFEETLYR